MTTEERLQELRWAVENETRFYDHECIGELLDLVEAQHEALMAWERETRFTPAHKKAMRAYNDFGGAK